MFNYIWPMGLIVLSNVVYQICAKSVPDTIHPMAALTVTYGVGMMTALILYFVMNHKDANLLREYQHLNWASFLLGFVVVGLEVGFLYAYQAGWTVSTAQVVQAIVVAILLIFVGALLFKEAITWNKIAGIVVCLAGLALINMK